MESSSLVTFGLKSMASESRLVVWEALKVTDCWKPKHVFAYMGGKGMVRTTRLMCTTVQPFRGIMQDTGHPNNCRVLQLKGTFDTEMTVEQRQVCDGSSCTGLYLT